jgi:hypothetical protein
LGVGLTTFFTTAHKCVQIWPNWINNFHSEIMFGKSSSNLFCRCFFFNC